MTKPTFTADELKEVAEQVRQNGERICNDIREAALTPRVSRPARLLAFIKQKLHRKKQPAVALREIVRMREKAQSNLLKYAQVSAPLVDPSFVQALCRALGDISVDEACTALDREQAALSRMLKDRLR